MRILEIIYNDFRSFRGERRISFVDPLTDSVKPISVLAGTNGTGKTSILETIEALLGLVRDPQATPQLLRQARSESYVGMTVQFDDAEGGDIGPGYETRPIHVGVGRSEWEPRDLLGSMVPFLGQLNSQGSSAAWPADSFAAALTKKRVQERTTAMENGLADMAGGLLYFPSDRRLRAGARSGPIQPPPEQRAWLFRYASEEASSNSGFGRITLTWKQVYARGPRSRLL